MKYSRFSAYLLAISLLYPATSNGVEPANDTQFKHEEMLRLKNQFNESVSDTNQSELNISSWPFLRPSYATRVLTINRYSYSYDLYMWWHEGYLFGQAVPLNGSNAFICGSGWTYVQEIAGAVSAFDTLRFDDVYENSVCDSYSIPIIFHITQWDFLYDYYVDFNQPFNIVNQSSAIEFVRVNGGVSSGATSTTSSRAYFSSGLDITIPSLDLTTSEGTNDVWLDLEFDTSSPAGTFNWTLRDAGYNN